MRSRTLLFLAFVALLGVATAVPALASASEAKLEVNQNCVDPNWPCWATPGSNSPALAVKIAAGDEVVFTDHDASRTATVVWTGTAPTKCSGIPASASTPWEGKCEFATSGTYKFESSTLFKEPQSAYGNNLDYTKYEIVVAGTPTDATTSASGETQTEAMLNGSIHPEGNTVEYHFEYGSGSVTEHTTSTSTLTAADFTSHSVSLPVTGLQPEMKYQFQLVATYGAGKTPVPGGAEMFSTLAIKAPTATTLAAEVSKETEATLKGTVNLGGEATEYFFEYGTDTNYGQKTAKVTLQTSAGSNQGVSTAIKGLTAGTEYHFRLVAENKHGSEKGVERSFKTMSTAAKEPTKEPPAKEPTPTATAGNPPATTSSSSSGQQGSEPASTPLFGSVKLASTQHGGVVRGSLTVSSSGSGGHLQIDLLSKGAGAPVGKFLRSALHAGKLTFTLALSARAKRLLKAHHRLTLTVKIVLTPAHGKAMTVSRSVLLRS